MAEEATTPMTAQAETGTADGTQQSAQATPPQQDDISGLVTKESRKAVEKLLHEAGITPGDNPEMKLKEYKKWLDGQKGDLEKALGDVTTLTADRDTALSEVSALKNRFAAVAKGIPADKADRYVKLAETYVTDKVDFDKALDAAILEFPLAESTSRVPGAGGNPPPMEQKTNGRPKGTVIF